MGLQQENPHKNNDYGKIVKKSTFFLKNRLTGINFPLILKIKGKIDPNFGAFKKAFVY